jgi:hypothetical protein
MPINHGTLRVAILQGVTRKIAAACLPLLALVALAGSSQARPQAQDDGCLVVEAGRGIVSFNAKGFLLGRFDQGTIDIEDPLPDDGSVRVFAYEKKRPLTETKTRYIGSLVRFRASGLFKVRIEAVGMELSLAGKGTATLNSDGFFDAGQYSTDAQSFCESRFQPMPDVPRKIVISEQTAS